MTVGMIQGKIPMKGTATLFPVVRALQAALTVLVIEAPDAMRFLGPRPDGQAVVLTHMRLLSAQMLNTVRPDAIIGPLIASNWDIVDLGITLESLGYSGDLFALTQPLPRAELVVREVGAVCPRLTVHLLETT